MAVRHTTPRQGEAADSSGAATFLQFRAGLQRFLMRRLHDAHDAQDLAQETYLRLLRVERGDLVRNPQAYLYRIASNLVYEFRLRERQEAVTFDSLALEHAAEHPQELRPDEATERIMSEEQLQAVLMQLSPIYRAILLLRKHEGQSYPQIAATLGISVHTVKKYLARAVAQCRAADWEHPDRVHP